MGTKSKKWVNRRRPELFRKRSKTGVAFRYQVLEQHKGYVYRWQDNLLTVTEELVWQHKKNGYELDQVVLRRWKGGWLFIWEVHTSKGKGLKFFSFGQTLTECIDGIWRKCKTGSFNWKLNGK